MTNFLPGSANEELLKSRCPSSHSCTNNLGLNVHIIFNVMPYCCMGWYHRWNGKAGSMELMYVVKWFFHVHIARLEMLNWWICGGVSWNVSSTSLINVFKVLETSLSKLYSYGLKPHLTSFCWIVVWVVTSSVPYLIFMGWGRMVLVSTQYTTITYFLTLLDMQGELPVWWL